MKKNCFFLVLFYLFFTKSFSQNVSSDSIKKSDYITYGDDNSIKKDSVIIKDITKRDYKILNSKKGVVTIGSGIGLPYGGIGARLGVNILDNLNLFGGAGFQLVGLGYNIGLLKDFKSKSLTQFYLVGMYGTNSGIMISGASEYNELYTGATFGAGLKLNSRHSNGNYWDLGLLVPIRSEDYKNAENSIKNNPMIVEFREAWPIGIVIGYNIKI